MTLGLGELAAFLLLTAAIGTAGVAFGILVLAPRLSRHAERNDEEPGAGSE
ncbi:MAG TPA: hypothetical protein VLS28_10680 [Candidatus Sulfomarinibacteraceae bacterium]|nr:hypothetical protein [Candidatus Sulfomarinibacteraceae bacterium]